MKEMRPGSLIKAAFPPGNWLYRGDCLDLLRDLNAQHESFIDLIYIDPPFNSERGYSVWTTNGEGESEQKRAFEDTWAGQKWPLELDTLARQGGDAVRAADFIRTHHDIFAYDAAAGYLTTMAVRICEMQKALKPTGTFYLHCDPRMSHSLKLLCDIIFGRDNFRNEIIWCYSGGGVSKKDFARKHDIILRYAKESQMVFNPQYVPYSEASRALVSKRGGTSIDGKKRDLKRGAHMPDWWSDLNSLQTWSPERVPDRYPTQKPRALIERIIKASSNKGDIIADFFCGCGTTVDAAERLDRHWIGCDISSLAISAIKKRLKDAKYSEGEALLPKTIEGAKTLAERSPLDFEDWVVRHLARADPNERRPQGGYDGSWPFFMPNGAKAECLFEVKSGAAGVGKLRDFVTSVKNKRDAEMGVFICFADKVGNLNREAAKHGRIGDATDTPPRIQILTVEELLVGKQPDYPRPAR